MARPGDRLLTEARRWPRARDTSCLANRRGAVIIKCLDASPDARHAPLSPSSRGPGRGPFKAKTRVRIPLGTPLDVGSFRRHGLHVIPETWVTLSDQTGSQWAR